MSQQPFKKFIKQKSNASVKEKYKQDKKTAKKEREQAINKRYEEKRALRNQAGELPRGPRQNTDRAGRPTSNDNHQGSFRRNGRYSGEGALRRDRKAETPARQSAAPATATAMAEMPLNKYLAHCGVGSRREVIPLIKEGKVTVNGKVVTEPGHKLTGKDEVVFNGKKLFVTRNMVYILLNKPKDYITTTDDPQGRRTVLQLIGNATSERVYPVGRLDRNTSGVLLLTNDGELTQKLTHPSYDVKKVYEVKLDKPLTKAHFDKIVNGIHLEDGEIHADSLAWPDPKDKTIIGIELHSGRNRIVRRMFEHFGYNVKGLDRVMYGTLTKKNVERGRWRYLSDKEIRMLKYLSPSPAPPKKKQSEK